MLKHKLQWYSKRKCPWWNSLGWDQESHDEVPDSNRDGRLCFTATYQRARRKAHIGRRTTYFRSEVYVLMAHIKGIILLSIFLNCEPTQKKRNLIPPLTAVIIRQSSTWQKSHSMQLGIFYFFLMNTFELSAWLTEHKNHNKVN